jgi:hypothetical protein
MPPLDQKRRADALGRIQEDAEAQKSMMNDLQVFALLTIPEEVRRAFSAGWVSGYVAAQALVPATGEPTAASRVSPAETLATKLAKTVLPEDAAEAYR